MGKTDQNLWSSRKVKVSKKPATVWPAHKTIGERTQSHQQRIRMALHVSEQRMNEEEDQCRHSSKSRSGPKTVIRYIYYLYSIYSILVYIIYYTYLYYKCTSTKLKNMHMHQRVDHRHHILMLQTLSITPTSMITNDYQLILWRYWSYFRQKTVQVLNNNYSEQFKKIYRIY